MARKLKIKVKLSKGREFIIEKWIKNLEEEEKDRYARKQIEEYERKKEHNLYFFQQFGY